MSQLRCLLLLFATCAPTASALRAMPRATTLRAARMNGPACVRCAEARAADENAEDLAVAPALTEEQLKVLMAIRDEFGQTGKYSFETSWDDIRALYPVLQGRTDEEVPPATWHHERTFRATARRSPPSHPPTLPPQLRTAVVSFERNWFDVLFKTPIGPLLVVNLLIIASGKSWCDTPWYNPGACPPPG